MCCGQMECSRIPFIQLPSLHSTQNTVFYKERERESSPTIMDSNELETHTFKLNEKQDASNITKCHFAYVLVRERMDENVLGKQSEIIPDSLLLRQ